MKTIQVCPVLILFLMLVTEPLKSQIQITSGPEVTPEQMVEKIVGAGNQFSNVQYTGAAQASGIFTNGSTTNLGIGSGVFLTSGAGIIIPGPNDSPSAGVFNMMAGDSLLTSITTGPTYDASILEFDILSESDTLRISYVFGGEEYNEWVGGSYNDVMGIFVSGLNPAGGEYISKNIAIVPGTTNTPVNVNSINNGYSPAGVIPDGPCVNCEYYTDNTGGLTLEYDGLTHVLIGKLPVVLCENYHIRIGIADCGDMIHDAGVFIAENSISSSPEIIVTEILEPPFLTDHIVEGHVEADLVFELPSAEYVPVTICYDIGGTAINGIDYEWIDNCITFNEGEDSLSFHIVPLYDGIIEGEETIWLIIENTLGCMIKHDTVEIIIQDYLTMISQTSSNIIICPETETELWVQVYNGFPPYQYYWEPGGFTDDTIVVSPESTTNYKVLCVDLLNDTIVDSVLVTVFNGNLNNILEFGFRMEDNPYLPYDITGNILQDSVLLFLPEGVPSMDLISSFSLPNCARTFVNGEEQYSGVSVQDFTGPVVYEVMAANGEVHNWLVIVETQTGYNEANPEGVKILPNPSCGKFYISSEIPCEIHIMDLTGRVVYESTEEIGGKTEIDMTDQPKGMYFLRVNMGDEFFTRKIVIQ